ncbi:MAG: hypothetical protein WBI14_01155 [Anaerolineaceae bacterium]
MDGFTEIDERIDTEARWRISDAINFATTNEEVEEIRASCEHRYHHMSYECWIYGHVQIVEELEADDIPF